MSDEILTDDKKEYSKFAKDNFIHFEKIFVINLPIFFKENSKI